MSIQTAAMVGRIANSWMVGYEFHCPAFVQAFVSYSCSSIQRHCRVPCVGMVIYLPLKAVTMETPSMNFVPTGVSSCEICNDECEIVTGVLQVCGDGEVQDAF